MEQNGYDEVFMEYSLQEKVFNFGSMGLSTLFECKHFTKLLLNLEKYLQA